MLTATRLSTVTERFLGHKTALTGFVSRHDDLETSIANQIPVAERTLRLEAEVEERRLGQRHAARAQIVAGRVDPAGRCADAVTAAREQLAVWADRNRVQIVSQEGGDPAAVTYDAVVAGKARKVDVVIADTAGRLPTQLHLMEELKKIRRVIGKAQDGAPHEVLLVVDGNTGQNALAQVRAFDAALAEDGARRGLTSIRAVESAPRSSFGGAPSARKASRA